MCVVAFLGNFQCRPKVSEYGMNEHCGLLVNSSRGIIYAGDEEDFAEKAEEAAQNIQKEMAEILKKY